MDLKTLLLLNLKTENLISKDLNDTNFLILRNEI